MKVVTLEKLVVVIPTFNEEKTIRSVIRQIPRNLARNTELIVVDKSIDSTSMLAKEEGALVINQHKGGLGTAFRLGIREGLKLNADVLVHIDGDMQYDPKEMYLLVQPILQGEADMVLGQRILQYKMPLINRLGNRFFSWLVSMLSGIHVSDAQTGYRALNKKALKALLSLQGDHTYTQESIVIAARRGLKIHEVPILFKKRNHGRSFINLLRYPIGVLAILAKAYFREFKFNTKEYSSQNN